MFTPEEGVRVSVHDPNVYPFPESKGFSAALGTSTSLGISTVRRTHGILARYVKLRVAHAPVMPGTFSPPPQFSDPDMHHGKYVKHVP